MIVNKIKIIKILLLQHSNIGNNAIHKKVINEFEKSEKFGIEFCKINNWEVDITDTLLIITSKDQFGFSMVAKIKKYKINYISNIYKLCKRLKINIDSHESDLYIIKNALTDKIINKYEFKINVSVFISEIDGTAWYEIPFAYDPFLEKTL